LPQQLGFLKIAEKARLRMKVPLFDIDLGEEERTAVLEVLESRWLSSGPRTAAFEDAFAAALGAPHAIAVANGTAALHLAMLAVGGIGPGDEVIVPSLTFVATANAVRYVGATPVFADISGDSDLNISPFAIEAAITPRTKAIIVMHYAGFPCDMGAIMPIAERHHLRVIEDACHAVLSEYAGRKLGMIGHVGCFSFFSNKNMTTAEGGMVVTSTPEIATRVRLLRSHAMTSTSYDRERGHATGYDVTEVGYNYRLDDLRSAIGLVQLAKLPNDIARRARLRESYERALAKSADVTVPFLGHSKEMRSNYIMVIRLKADSARRDRVRAALSDRGIQTSMHYPPLHRLKTFADRTIKLPNTESAAASLITLPFFKTMTSEQLDHVVSGLMEAIAA
jgi:dTDP-4-amino-4,6-dideoxygalactose transaminase